MADEVRVSRPQPQPQPVPRPEAVTAQQVKQAKNSVVGWLVVIVIVIVLAVLAVLFRNQLFSTNTNGSYQYQAVFLTNGQVYFGKLSDPQGNYLKLTDIYYLQVVQPPLQGSGNASSSQQSQISLVKLGNELHGPADEMYISRDQVLFYENLKNDGEVVKAIDQYKANPSPTPTSGQ